MLLRIFLFFYSIFLFNSSMCKIFRNYLTIHMLLRIFFYFLLLFYIFLNLNVFEFSRNWLMIYTLLRIFPLLLNIIMYTGEKFRRNGSRERNWWIRYKVRRHEDAAVAKPEQTCSRFRPCFISLADITRW